jgi:hypothetical protein
LVWAPGLSSPHAYAAQLRCKRRLPQLHRQRAKVSATTPKLHLRSQGLGAVAKRDTLSAVPRIALHDGGMVYDRGAEATLQRDEPF